MEKTLIRQSTTHLSSTNNLKPYLKIQSPDNRMTRFLLSKNALVIGRGDKCDVVLKDNQISREHCRIWIDELDNIVLEDLRSTNGTRMDGKTILQEKLLANNRVKIGEHIIKIEFKDANEIRQEELLAAAATTDPLTGIANRKWFAERVSHLFNKIMNDNRIVTIVMLDIDHFKQVNDTYGHQMGDVVIKGVAEILNKNIRHQDFLARYGGEEFIVCLPENTAEDAYQFCERVRQQVEAQAFRFGRQYVNVTVSIGANSCLVKGFTDIEVMTKSADDALYECKRGGRNCTKIT